MKHQCGFVARNVSPLHSAYTQKVGQVACYKWPKWILVLSFSIWTSVESYTVNEGNDNSMESDNNSSNNNDRENDNSKENYNNETKTI